MLYCLESIKQTNLTANEKYSLSEVLPTTDGLLYIESYHELLAIKLLFKQYQAITFKTILYCRSEQYLMWGYGSITVQELIVNMQEAKLLQRSQIVTQYQGGTLLIARAQKATQMWQLHSERGLFFVIDQNKQYFIGFFSTQNHKIQIHEPNQQKQKLLTFLRQQMVDKSKYFQLSQLNKCERSFQGWLHLKRGENSVWFNFQNQQETYYWLNFINSKLAQQEQRKFETLKEERSSKDEEQERIAVHQRKQKQENIGFTAEQSEDKRQQSEDKRQQSEDKGQLRLYISKIQQQNLQLKAQLNQTNFKFEQFKKQAETKFQQLSKNNKDLTVKNQTLMEEIKSIEQVSKAKIENMNSEFQAQIQSLQQISKAEITKLNERFQTDKQSMEETSKAEIERLTAAFEKCKENLEQAEAKINRYQQRFNQYRESEQTQQQIRKELEQKLKQNQKLERKYQFETLKMQSTLSSLQNEQYLHIFQENILHNLLEEKKFLRAQIEKCTQKKVLFTRLIYRLDPLNSTNFHKYIDQRPNFCIIIKLKNNRTIAGFSVSPLSTKTIATQKGIICSLTEKKTFKLFEGKRSVTYDAFFLIFGNSELRLKQGENKFFTNFGIANSFYDANGQKYTVLNGEGVEREVQFEDFQIFEIVFQ